MAPLTPLFLVCALFALFLAERTTVLTEGAAVSFASLGPSAARVLRRGRGRPRKFAGPTRAVTLTLPEHVIDGLGRLHRDLSKAVVALLARHPSNGAGEPAELQVFGTQAVITVQPTPALEERAGVQLVPLSDGRALIALDAPKTIAEFELTIDDALADSTLKGGDRKVFERISELLKDARRSADVSLVHRSIMVLESTRRARREKRPVRPRRRAG